MVKEKIK